MHLLISIFITFISDFGALLVQLVGGFNTQNVKLKIQKKITHAFWVCQWLFMVGSNIICYFLKLFCTMWFWKLSSEVQKLEFLYFTCFV